ncbi:hypothetical protein J3U78_19005 [Sporosarcina sp. Te-1]|nr:hypothetical protein J3U78_19005 [Sporosarcina sp. Te-1]
MFLLLLVVSGIFVLPMTSVLADEENTTNNKEIDISLSPTDTLFDVNNMKPGDWAPRTLTVKNSGNKDFAYYMQMKNNGEEKLFNELLLEITAGNEELYKGKLAAFTTLPARNLVSGSEENLEITIRFPEHLGNDFQGLQAAFILSFTAEGKESASSQAVTKARIDSGDASSSNGFKLPATATNMFNLLFLGSVLVVVAIVIMIVAYFRRMKVAQ